MEDHFFHMPKSMIEHEPLDALVGTATPLDPEQKKYGRS